MDKQRRKVEADLKITQEMVNDHERDQKGRWKVWLLRKKKISTYVKAWRWTEQCWQTAKGHKEMQSRIESNEEELEAERHKPGPRLKSREEHLQGAWWSVLKDLMKLVEPSAQIELNKKREAEIGKLQKRSWRG